MNTVFVESSRMSWNVGENSRGEYEWLMSRVGKYKTLIGSNDCSEMAYKYVFSQPVRPTVILGCTSMSQIKENVRIASSFMDSSMFELLSRSKI